MVSRSNILDTAKAFVTQDRAATHGNAERGFAQIAAFWSADLGIPLDAQDVARLMVLFKTARAKGNPRHADNWIDLAGYAACGGEIATDIATPTEGISFDAHMQRRYAVDNPPADQEEPEGFISRDAVNELIERLWLFMGENAFSEEYPDAREDLIRRATILNVDVRRFL